MPRGGQFSRAVDTIGLADGSRSGIPPWPQSSQAARTRPRPGHPARPPLVASCTAMIRTGSSHVEHPGRAPSGPGRGDWCCTLTIPLIDCNPADSMTTTDASRVFRSPPLSRSTLGPRPRGPRPAERSLTRRGHEQHIRGLSPAPACPSTGDGTVDTCITGVEGLGSECRTPWFATPPPHCQRGTHPSGSPAWRATAGAR
jgi:hypothetical protein